MDSYFRTTSYAFIATAFLALALTGDLDALSILLYAAALVFSYYRDVRGATRLRLREWMWRTLAILYIPFLFIDATIFSSQVIALAHLTLFASAAKLFQNKRDRDWVFLYLIAFFQMLLAAGLTINTTFIVSLALFLFFFVSTLAAFEIRRARREVSHTDEETITPIKQKPARRRAARDTAAAAARGNGGRTRYLMGASLFQVCLVALLTLPFFFLFPRFGSGGVGGSFGESQAATGFSETVNLGEVASIKKSQRVVMRIELDRAPSRYLRWRGVALEQYLENGSWSLIRGDRYRDVRKGGVFKGEAADMASRIEYGYELLDPPREPVLPLGQRVILERLDTPTIFMTQKAVKLRGAIKELKVDKYTGALAAYGIPGRVQYTGVSDLAVPDEQTLRNDTFSKIPLEIANRYTKLPRLDPRIERLAREITRGTHTNFDKARAIESFLKTNFQYSLELKPATGEPLSEFLFENYKGHCEYFASAMVIMLRSIDIPARIVNGFQMGEYNDVNDLYVVRESDAHSWVEVYFPQSASWVEFDPTPAAGLNDYNDSGLFSWFRKYMDALEVFWIDYIVTLDSEEQASIAAALQRWMLSIKDTVKAYYEGAKDWVKGAVDTLLGSPKWSLESGVRLLLLVVGLIAVVGFAYAAASYRKRGRAPRTGYGPWWHRLFVLPTWRRRRLRNGDHRETAVLFYEQMLAIAKRAGLMKKPHETPVEFATASGFNEVREITLLYNRVRFGGAPLDESESQRISSLLAQLKKTVRKK
jgi:transglutaminase-like putative cysteine protease